MSGSSVEGAGADGKAQKRASIGVCASSSANIGVATIAVKAKMAMQTMTTALVDERMKDILRQRTEPEPEPEPGTPSS